MEKIALKIERMNKGSWGKIRAFFDLQTEDGFTLKGFKLVEGINGLFVGFPSQKGSDDEYHDTIWADREVKEQVNQLAIKTYGQITVTDTDLVDVGDVIFQATDNTLASTINIGNTGINQTWDFSTLQESSIGNLLFISPIGTAYQNQYPNANLCMNDNGSLSYYNKTTTGLFIHGINDTVFHSPTLFYPLPLTYGLTISDGPILIIDNVITGPLLSLALPPSPVDPGEAESRESLEGPGFVRRAGHTDLRGTFDLHRSERLPASD